MDAHSPALGRFILRRTNRRTLAISVLPDGTLEVVSPAAASVADILQKLSRRRNWILRQRHYFASMRQEQRPRRYCSGSTHRYLGRQYRLKVRRARAPSVKLRGGYLHVLSPSVSPDAVKELISRWMKDKARTQFDRRLAKWSGWCAHARLPEPRLLLRDMPKRWGSTHKNGLILLNPELVRAPGPCIDYVIAHEVCHLKHPGHTRTFYAQLGRMCPRWKDLKRRLEMAEV